jgi:hypothetical protein
MRKSRSSGTVGERGGNDPLYPDIDLRLSINSGYRWSRASVFPVKAIGFSNLANKLNVK